MLDTMVDLRSEEENQRKLCSNSRKNHSAIPDRMGRRVIRNINEAYRFFEGYGSSVLDVGCGDGLGIAHFKELGMAQAYGIEFVQERVDTARSFGLDVIKGMAEDLSAYGNRTVNIFCSHTLEHTLDFKKAIEEIKRVAYMLVWIIVPIEANTKNGAHHSPIRSLSQIREHFPETDWIKIKEVYKSDLEPEGIIAFVRNIVALPI